MPKPKQNKKKRFAEVWYLKLIWFPNTIPKSKHKTACSAGAVYFLQYIWLPISAFHQNNFIYAHLASRNTGIPCRFALYNGVQQGESEEYLQKIWISKPLGKTLNDRSIQILQKISILHFKVPYFFLRSYSNQTLWMGLNLCIKTLKINKIILPLLKIIFAVFVVFIGVVSFRLRSSFTEFVLFPGDLNVLMV